MVNLGSNQLRSEYEALQNTSKSVSTNAASIGSVLFNFKNKKVRVQRSKVKDVAKGLAEIAYSMGETNDPDFFAEEMTETIFAALKKASEKKDTRKKTR